MAGPTGPVPPALQCNVGLTHNSHAPPVFSRWAQPEGDVYTRETQGRQIGFVGAKSKRVAEAESFLLNERQN